jgi:thymidylate kinase
MLKIIQRLIENLDASGLPYCHWKSNMALAAGLEGRTDIDLLLRPESAAAFGTILQGLDFRQADTEDGEQFPAMEHYYGLDEESGVLAHVHIYYAVITGESLTKNFQLPLEEMLFGNLRRQDGVWVPTKGAELIIFTVRMMLKHTTPVELLLLMRDWPKVKQEAVWLTEGGSIRDSLRLLREWLPAINSDLFSQCVVALRGRGTLTRRIALGYRVRRNLREYARHSIISSTIAGARKLSAMVARRMSHAGKGMALRSGGAVIAFVGPEATGKSTLLSETKGWLGEHFAVEQIHAGKPKSTALSAAPNLLVPALRSLLPGYRSGNVEVQYLEEDTPSQERKTYPLIFGIRSVLLAYDRRALLTRAYARAAAGTIVLCDRYPSATSGAPDSPQLSRFDVSRRSPLRYLLARIENHLYTDIPAPNVIISLSVPLEVAITRNKTRGKEEPEEFVRRRHAQSEQLAFENTRVVRVCTDRPLDQTVSDVKQAIWQALNTRPADPRGYFNAPSRYDASAE